MDTIYALASARGRAGVAVFRVSGPLAWEIAEAISGPLPPPRQAALRILKRANGDVLDSALVLCFENGRSFTGDFVVEFQLHGGIATIAAVQAEIAALSGTRLADPGEFTRRALDSGKLDLTQVEALSDLLEAETEAQRFQAMRALSGAIGQTVSAWRAKLIKAAALLEISIDFVDEDILGDFSTAIFSETAEVLEQIRKEITGQSARERVRAGFEVAIVGAVNSGKSTLMNALAGREASIISSHAGTTRDVIEVRMDISGLAVTLLDTAGLRETDDEVEALGIARGRIRAEEADLRVIVLESPDEVPKIALRPDDIVVVGKNDVWRTPQGGISGRTGEGIDLLVESIGKILSGRVAADGIIVRDRQRAALHSAEIRLQLVCDALSAGEYLPELVAMDLRSACHALDVLIGKVDVEDLLGDIFANFCIGK
jgi:tRNA modification GTPase